jgi:hypothetical protein
MHPAERKTRLNVNATPVGSVSGPDAVVDV